MQKSEAGLPEMRSKEKDKKFRKKAWGAYFNMWMSVGWGVQLHNHALCELNYTFKETRLKEITTTVWFHEQSHKQWYNTQDMVSFLNTVTVQLCRQT